MERPLCKDKKTRRERLKVNTNDERSRKYGDGKRKGEKDDFREEKSGEKEISLT